MSSEVTITLPDGARLVSVGFGMPAAPSDKAEPVEGSEVAASHDVPDRPMERQLHIVPLGLGGKKGLAVDRDALGAGEVTATPVASGTAKPLLAAEDGPQTVLLQSFTHVPVQDVVLAPDIVGEGLRCEDCNGPRKGLVLVQRPTNAGPEVKRVCLACLNRARVQLSHANKAFTAFTYRHAPDWRKQVRE